MPAWSPERIEKLRQLCEQGLSAGRIALELGGVTRDAVIGKAWRLKLPRRHPPRAYDAQTLPRGRQRQNGGRPPKVREMPVDKKPSSISIVSKPLESLWVRFTDLESHHCRWPSDERGDDGVWLFCGTTKVTGCSFCAKHRKIAYQRVTT